MRSPVTQGENRAVVRHGLRRRPSPDHPEDVPDGEYDGEGPEQQPQGTLGQQGLDSGGATTPTARPEPTRIGPRMLPPPIP